MHDKGQVSIEYLILTGFFLAAIIIPGVLFLYSLSTEGVQETVSQQRAKDFGLKMTSVAQEAFYLGLYSKQVVNVEIPRNTEKLLFVHIFYPDPSTGIREDFYYTGLVIDDGNRYRSYYQFDVPVIAAGITPVSTDSDVEECDTLDTDGDPDTGCEIYVLSGLSSGGTRSFKVETRINAPTQKAMVFISQEVE